MQTRNPDNFEHLDHVDIGVCSFTGSRDEQQDALFYSVMENMTVVILCDGMGGMHFGAAAANAAIDVMKRQMDQKPDFRLNVPDFFVQAIPALDTAVLNIADSYPDSCKAGTTIVCTVLVDNRLFWLSIGDSRLYILRDGEMVCATRDHNYLYTLDYLLQEGKIDQSFYGKEKETKGGALTSYLGMGGIDFYDISQSPFPISPGDVLLATTDGLYKALTDREICAVLQRNENAQKAADELLSVVKSKNISGQDNTSFVIVKII